VTLLSQAAPVPFKSPGLVSVSATNSNISPISSPAISSKDIKTNKFHSNKLTTVSTDASIETAGSVIQSSRKPGLAYTLENQVGGNRNLVHSSTLPRNFSLAIPNNEEEQDMPGETISETVLNHTIYSSAHHSSNGPPHSNQLTHSHIQHGHTENSKRNEGGQAAPVPSLSSSSSQRSYLSVLTNAASSLLSSLGTSSSSK